MNVEQEIQFCFRGKDAGDCLKCREAEESV